jgi:hypothetical protein
MLESPWTSACPGQHHLSLSEAYRIQRQSHPRLTKTVDNTTFTRWHPSSCSRSAVFPVGLLQEGYRRVFRICAM